jgi:hypothetical protein
MLPHHHISSSDSGLSVANSVGEAYGDVVGPVRKEAWRLRGHGGLCIDDGWEGFILDLDEFGSILSLSAVLGYDNGHRLTHIAYPIERQWQLRCSTQDGLQARL